MGLSRAGRVRHQSETPNELFDGHASGLGGAKRSHTSRRMAFFAPIDCGIGTLPADWYPSMRTAFTHMTLFLCIFMQLWYGSTYRAGMVLCVPTTTCEHETEVAWVGEGHCSHHAPVGQSTPHPAPAHQQDCPCCVDVPMPDSTVPPTGILVMVHGADLPHVAGLPAAILPGPEFGVTPSWLSARPHPPDGRARRLASGVLTTRILI